MCGSFFFSKSPAALVTGVELLNALRDGHSVDVLVCTVIALRQLECSWKGMVSHLPVVYERCTDYTVVLKTAHFAVGQVSKQ